MMVMLSQPSLTLAEVEEKGPVLKYADLFSNLRFFVDNLNRIKKIIVIILFIIFFENFRNIN